MADKTKTDIGAKSGKSQALQLAVDQIEKQFGKGSIMRLGDRQHANVETIPTGSISLDLALGGGIPKGRVIEVYGPESSGKPALSCMRSLRFRLKAARPLMWMLSTLLTQPMPSESA